MRIPIPLALLAAVFAGTPAFAAPAPLWFVDKPHSKVAFTASMSRQPINGVFRRYDTKISFDPANLAGSSVMTVIDTASAFTGDASRDETLPTPEWFNVRAFPKATFRSTSFKTLGQGRYVAVGTLTIRGVSRPVNLPFKLTITGKQARMDGSLSIDRRWFGVGQGQFAGTESVGAAVRINVTIAARQQ
jgi:polyisoprenoid-binding protein YceI